MSPLQKDAIFSIVITAVSAALFLFLLFYKNFQIAFAAFAVLGLIGLAPRLFYRKAGKRLLLDERDRDIADKAAKVGFRLFWVAFITVAVLTALIMGDGVIPASSLTYAALGGFIIIFIGRAIAVLVLYRQGAK